MLWELEAGMRNIRPLRDSSAKLVILESQAARKMQA